MLETLGPLTLTSAHVYALAPSAVGVSAGFPSPAQDHYRGPIDLNEILIQDKTSTFLLRVAGDSMTGAGIFDGDHIIVDRSLTPTVGDVVVAIIDGDLTLKTLAQSSSGWILRAQNPRFASIPLEGDMEMTVWGVVTYNLHPQR